MLVIAFFVIIIELVPMLKKRQGKEASILILFGALTIAYGYYFNTHRYSASLVELAFKLFNIR